VDKENEVPDTDLEDTGTSPASPKNMAASEERCIVQGSAPPTTLASPLHNHRHIQANGSRAPAESDVLENGTHGVHEEVNAPI
jgi:hypothetical protein